MTARLKVKDLNRLITCRLCDGYLIEATTLVECLHTFCKGCILKNFESKLCPLCNMDYKKKTQSFRSDPQLQSLVYKLIPNLYTKEIQRRDDFYRSATVRASSSCSDDSVIDKERNLITNVEEEDLIMQQVGERTKFLSADDLISLSLEYYQIHLDDTDVQMTDRRRLNLNETESTNNNNNSNSNNNNNSDNVQHHKNNGQSSDKSSDQGHKDGDKRFLSCPAAVSMRHLQKFVRMKYALTADHRVDIIYKGEVLNDSLSLMDVAYIFKWNRTKPMRFFYRIFTPMKVRPIKIVNTTLSTGGKQLQIVPVKPNSDAKTDEDPATLSDKEKLFAHLQLQSKAKVQTQEVKKDVKVIPDCVFDYNETEEEEIKKFAESRDREWALQKQLDEKSVEYHHISKKRKKNKHSKNDFLHKKRKLHAEKITTDELKLKLKLTNGHKHKHHKEKEVSSKEKLLQMRQVRHKTPLVAEEKPQTLEPQPQVPMATIKIPKSVVENTNKETFLKTFQSCTEKLQEKIPTVAKDPLMNQKLVSLQQRCTVQPKLTQVVPPKIEKKVNFELYPAGFTVSKVESGLKRKIEDKQDQDKRPSLEITLINPSPPPAITPKTGEKPTAKRPPPATIPLERIKKSMGLKSGISIIPKLPEKCDNIGALDLTKHKPELTNGINKQQPINNLQILSKVASERPTINNKTLQINNKIPNLPALNAMKIPKLNEIKFRTMQTPIRNIRPSQNQNIRNIPNPSLLIKQQNQNRLNSFNNAEKTTVNETKPVIVPKPSALAVESKICEKNEISV